MKTLVFVLFLAGSLYILSCKNKDTTTQMPNGGYKERSDSGTSMPTAPDSKDRGAVAVDTVKNGQVTVSGSGTSGATADSAKK